MRERECPACMIRLTSSGMNMGNTAVRKRGGWAAWRRERDLARCYQVLRVDKPPDTGEIVDLKATRKLLIIDETVDLKVTHKLFISKGVGWHDLRQRVVFAGYGTSCDDPCIDFCQAPTHVPEKIANIPMHTDSAP